MQKPSALVVSAAIAFFLFSPVACFSDQQQSKDCCGCMGDHGGYECIDNEGIDPSKAHYTSFSSSTSASLPPPPPPPPAEDDADASQSCATDLVDAACK